MRSFTNFQVLDNSIQSWLIFIVVILAAFLFNRYVSRLLSGAIHELLRRFIRDSSLTKFHSLVIPPLEYFVMFMILFFAFQTLTYPEPWKIMLDGHHLQSILGKLLHALILLSFTLVLLRIVDFLGYIFKERAELTESKIDNQLVPFIKDLLKVFISISAGFVLLGGVLGFDVTSLLAGLGIGGLALAFAAQESIKDLFGSLTIFLDKPFRLGDVVKVGDVSGTVEKVGIRSTRIRSGDKTLITLPNKKMVDTNVENITMRSLRRVNLTIGITYETGTEALKKIISELREYFDHPEIFPDENYVLFHDFGESGLIIRIEYFTTFLPWLEFLRKKEEVNFKIMEIVSHHGGAFAHPVREIKIDPSYLRNK